MVPQHSRGGIVECGGLFILLAPIFEGSFEGDRSCDGSRSSQSIVGAQSHLKERGSRCGVTILPLRW